MTLQLEYNENFPQESVSPTETNKWAAFVLLFSVCLIATCAIIYELIIAAVSSYLLGNSVYQFSVTIGLFMSSMGLGSYLSRYFSRCLVNRFILIEIAIALIGGISSAALFNTYIFYESAAVYLVVMFILITSIGTLVGLEIPILTRIIGQYDSLRVTLSNVLAFDYIGALIGSVIFPLILLKYTGLVQSAFIVSLLNVFVAGLLLFQYWKSVEGRYLLIFATVLTSGSLAVAAMYSTDIDNWLESKLYRDHVQLSKQSRYQKIVLTKRDGQKDLLSADDTIVEPSGLEVTNRRKDLRLFIDGNLQFSSVDEYRYHEALVHPAMNLADKRANVLILGGGDGLAAREVLRYPEVKRIVLIDIDPEITKVCSSYPEIVELNQGSLLNAKVTVINQDAYKFVEWGYHNQKFDVVIIDLPDPNRESLSKLYSVTFYRLIGNILNAKGVIVTQSTSPFFSRDAFWCIHHTIEEAELYTYAYHLDIPSMGDWGFNLSAKTSHEIKKIRLSVETNFLTNSLIQAMFQFGKDVNELETKINTLLKPVLMFYYEDKNWRYY
ncbi:TPA: polyamine aminopropyltransferase [Candidatus Poribacteria bacterium]|nr:polyamine aminopropyltransferase [Candidatus Poribacteria bacterium]HIB85847.1 polyamine aminopropyltransferase [Candidatus Poribacteria bacterium]HIC02437.1 polyamine aminopropyltransferase [Candidatus Poribacteria bacterium]HIN31776.1 polyamine aminopropyltransferase [Candidatus Poribacteria bacterium]HIO08849.1 polyamine aminopropyltransferase [Candidatus Poribacteria bacterium]